MKFNVVCTGSSRSVFLFAAKYAFSAVYNIVLMEFVDHAKPASLMWIVFNYHLHQADLTVMVLLIVSRLSKKGKIISISTSPWKLGSRAAYIRLVHWLSCSEHHRECAYRSGATNSFIPDQYANNHQLVSRFLFLSIKYTQRIDRTQTSTLLSSRTWWLSCVGLRYQIWMCFRKLAAFYPRRKYLPEINVQILWSDRHGNHEWCCWELVTNGNICMHGVPARHSFKMLVWKVDLHPKTLLWYDPNVYLRTGNKKRYRILVMRNSL